MLTNNNQLLLFIALNEDVYMYLIIIIHCMWQQGPFCSCVWLILAVVKSHAVNAVLVLNPSVTALWQDNVHNMAHTCRFESLSG